MALFWAIATMRIVCIGQIYAFIASRLFLATDFKKVRCEVYSLGSFFAADFADFRRFDTLFEFN
jgi:hypothetical protein